jgi:hypothetical protein
MAMFYELWAKKKKKKCVPRLKHALEFPIIPFVVEFSLQILQNCGEKQSF